MAKSSRPLRVTCTVALAGPLAAFLLGACSFLVSTSDLADGDAGRASSDATSDQIRDGVADANASIGDASTRDAGNADADADANTNDSGSDAGFCPPNAIFCDDFERASMVQGWDGTVALNDASIDFVDGTPTGRALHAHVAPADAGSTNDYIWKQTDKTPTQTATLSMAVRVPIIPAQGPAHLGQLAFHDSSSAFSLLMPFLNSGQLIVAEFRCNSGNCQYAQSSLPAPTLSAGKWHQVSVSVTFGSASTSLSVSLDGTVIGQKASTVGMVPGAIEIRAGLVVVDSPNDAYDLEVDRLVVTSQ